MRIRDRMLLNNLIVGLLPIVIGFAAVIAVIQFQSDRYLRGQLTDSVQAFKQLLDAELQKYGDYSHFIARLYPAFRRRTSESGRNASYFEVSANRYNIRMFEVYDEQKLSFREMYSWKDNAYLTGTNIAAELWATLQNPSYSRFIKYFHPEIVSNVVVVRNCSLIFDDRDDSKIGFSVVITPLDREFFALFPMQDPDKIYFIRSAGGVQFSSDDLQNAADEKAIMDLAGKSRSSMAKVKLPGAGEFYTYREELFNTQRKKHGKTVRETVAEIGILYPAKSAGAQVSVLFTAVTVIFVLGIVIFTSLAFVFSRSLVDPVRDLALRVEEFERTLIPVKPPLAVKDEIDSLHLAFSRMTENILEKARELRESEELNRLRSDLISNVSHELRTPITGIFGIAELLASGDISPDESGPYYETILRESRGLRKIVNNLLFLSLTEKEKPRNQVLCLSEVAADFRQKFLGREFSEVVEKKHLTVAWELPPSAERIKIRTDIALLEHVLSELFHNAAIYNREGGNIFLEASLTGDSLVFRIRDTGIGIAPEHTPRIFERFYRVDSYNEYSIPGIGLGLSVVQAICSRMGWHIRLESQPGVGTVAVLSGIQLAPEPS